MAIGFGCGVGLASLNVFFPDLSEGVGIVLRLAIWAAPVIFPLSFYLEHGLGPLVAVNPATAPIIALRDLFIFDRMPSTGVWLTMAAWTVVTWLAGGLVMRGLRREIRDAL